MWHCGTEFEFTNFECMIVNDPLKYGKRKFRQKWKEEEKCQTKSMFILSVAAAPKAQDR